VRLRAAGIDVGLYLVGVLLLAMVLGAVAAFHPAALFNSPDLDAAEAWQGGWTTKGVGALVAVEAYLLGLLTWQAHLGSKHGSSIGKLLAGAKVARIDGKKPSFVRMVFLRQWLWAILPLGVAASMARPFSARTLFEHVPTWPTAAAALAAVAVAVGSAVALGGSQGVHDRIAGTHVVVAEPLKLPWLQLGKRAGSDPLIMARLLLLAAVAGVLAILSAVVLAGVSFWIF
jgi:uncharacterized RDD family membrane protein YckC